MHVCTSLFIYAMQNATALCSWGGGVSVGLIMTTHPLITHLPASAFSWRTLHLTMHGYFYG
jgi:hypothetical protein